MAVADAEAVIALSDEDANAKALSPVVDTDADALILPVFNENAEAALPVVDSGTVADETTGSSADEGQKIKNRLRRRLCPSSRS